MTRFFHYTPTRNAATQRKYPINAQIPHHIVILEDADGTHHHAQKVSKILETIDTKTHLIRLISHEPPIVRIYSILEDKMAKLERKAEKKALERKGKIITKEMKLTWLTADADFEHKIQKVKEELEKGFVRVDVKFVPKRGVRAPTSPEMHEHMQKVADMLQDVSNEWKERSIFKGEATLHLQSTVKKALELPSKEELETLAKKRLEKRERVLHRMDKEKPQRKPEGLGDLS
ncbi:unnamed protein product [Cyclocybe aegerita]|uniref:Uncharacterized protein n=1 Tax=Cyclocybe aegerita TaxID=1973307 RepID=A0A8S0XKN2_CYCAE|nr:unnamed protein product [Cyclocybe aegerita]